MWDMVEKGPKRRFAQCLLGLPIDNYTVSARLPIDNQLFRTRRLLVHIIELKQQM